MGFLLILQQVAQRPKQGSPQAFTRQCHPQECPLLIALLVESQMIMLVPTQLEHVFHHLAYRLSLTQALLPILFLQRSPLNSIPPLPLILLYATHH